MSSNNKSGSNDFMATQIKANTGIATSSGFVGTTAMPCMSNGLDLRDVEGANMLVSLKFSTTSNQEHDDDITTWTKQLPKGLGKDEFMLAYIKITDLATGVETIKKLRKVCAAYLRYILLSGQFTQSQQDEMKLSGLLTYHITVIEALQQIAILPSNQTASSMTVKRKLDFQTVDRSAKHLRRNSDETMMGDIDEQDTSTSVGPLTCMDLALAYLQNVMNTPPNSLATDQPISPEMSIDDDDDDGDEDRDDDDDDYQFSPRLSRVVKLKAPSPTTPPATVSKSRPKKAVTKPSNSESKSMTKVPVQCRPCVKKKTKCCRAHIEVMIKEKVPCRYCEVSGQKCAFATHWNLLYDRRGTEIDKTPICTVSGTEQMMQISGGCDR